MRRMSQQAKKSFQHGAPTAKQQVAPLDHVAYTWGKSKDRARKHSWWFKYAQAFFGLAPIPLGCYLLCAPHGLRTQGDRRILLKLPRFHTAPLAIEHLAIDRQCDFQLQPQPATYCNGLRQGPLAATLPRACLPKGQLRALDVCEEYDVSRRAVRARVIVVR